MKKTTFIIVGLVIVGLLVAVWVYLLLFNTNDQNGDNNIFTNLGNFFSRDVDSEFPVDNNQGIEEIPLVNTDGSSLRQLTTTPVIGFTDIFNEENFEFFTYYAEAGTGHIYRINMESGQEERVSNTTIPQADKAEFSPDGQTVAIRANKEVVLGTLTAEGSLSNRSLPYEIVDFTFSNRGELLFAERSNSGLIGRSLDPNTLSVTTIFNIPIQSVNILWSKDNSTPHFVYTKTSSSLMGYLYSIRAGRLQREPVSGLNLTAVANNNLIIFNTLNPDRSFNSQIFNRTTGEFRDSGLRVIPEKCFLSSSNTLFCGTSLNETNANYPENWYKGTLTTNDNIMRTYIDEEGDTSVYISSPKASTGRELDITNLTPTDSSVMLYFLNNNDKTLWYYGG